MERKIAAIVAMLEGMPQEEDEPHDQGGGGGIRKGIALLEETVDEANRLLEKEESDAAQRSSASASCFASLLASCSRYASANTLLASIATINEQLTAAESTLTMAIAARVLHSMPGEDARHPIPGSHPVRYSTVEARRVTDEPSSIMCCLEVTKSDGSRARCDRISKYTLTPKGNISTGVRCVYDVCGMCAKHGDSSWWSNVYIRDAKASVGQSSSLK